MMFEEGSQELFEYLSSESERGTPVEEEHLDALYCVDPSTGFYFDFPALEEAGDNS